MRVAWLIALVLCLSCQESDPAPPAPLGGGGPSPGTGGGGGGMRDGGAVEDGAPADAAALDAAMACTEVDPDDFDNRALVIQAGIDLAFQPRRAFATWTPGPCTGRRQLVIVLTERDECTLGVGRRLVFVMDADEIGEGLIPVGSPIQIAFSSAMSVLFIAPPSDGVPATTWSNCTRSDGDVTWEFLDPTPGRQTGVFTMSLLDCLGEPAAAPISVSGQVDVTLDTTFEDVCL